MAIKMEKSNNLKNCINEALALSKQKWDKICEKTLKGKHAKHNLGILALLVIYGDKSTWDLAKLYLEKIEPEKVKTTNAKSFFHDRMVENSIIYKRLKFLEEKGYVQKINRAYHATFKAWLLLMLVNPKIVEMLPLERLDSAIQEIKLNKAAEDFAVELFSINESSKEELWKTFQNLVKEPLAAKTFSDFFANLLWAWKISFDDIEESRLFELLIMQVKRQAEKMRGKNSLTLTLPV